MSTLHTLSAIPDAPTTGDCLRLLAEGDALLLLGDGVYSASLVSEVDGIELYALSTDAFARGVSTLPDSITLVDMAGFVALTERFARQVAWY